jgi:hypothetical protein
MTKPVAEAWGAILTVRTPDGQKIDLRSDHIVYMHRSRGQNQEPVTRVALTSGEYLLLAADEQKKICDQMADIYEAEL